MTKDHAPIQCNPHPDAPHGFSRDGSHNLGRYVCDCEGWAPDENMTKDQAIAQSAADKLAFYKGEKDKTVSALRAWGKQLQPPAPDCRTCVNRYNGDITWVCGRDCTNGDQYQPAPAVVLWRTE